MDKIRKEWNQAMTTHNFKAITFYKVLIDNGTRVPWRNLIRSNKGQLRAVYCLWQACHGKLATKDRLKRTRHIWKETLEWFNIQHKPQQWET
ncbi:unnamed protein product [Lathyrus sativus]|nr:unnamed protein product [Lathyrus sativus]